MDIRERDRIRKETETEDNLADVAAKVFPTDSGNDAATKIASNSFRQTHKAVMSRIASPLSCQSPNCAAHVCRWFCPRLACGGELVSVLQLRRGREIVRFCAMTLSGSISSRTFQVAPCDFVVSRPAVRGERGAGANAPFVDPQYAISNVTGLRFDRDLKP